MPVAQGNKWLMDGIIKIDSKLISVPLLKMKSPESISLVMDTFCKTTMAPRPLLFVYGCVSTSGSSETDFQVQRDSDGELQYVRHCTKRTTTLEKIHTPQRRLRRFHGHSQ